LAAIAARTADDFIGYADNLDGAAGKAAAINDALNEARNSGADLGDVVHAANESLSEIGLEPI